MAEPTSPNDVIERLEARAKRLGRGDYYNWNDAALDRSAASLIKTLSTELDMLTKAGIIEVAIRNPNVADYMAHWEGRAEKAEAALTQAVETEREECAKVADAHAAENWGMTEEEHAAQVIASAIRARSTQDKT